MAIELKSGGGSDLAQVDALSKAIRVTNYGSDGIEGHGLHPLPEALAVSSVTEVDNDIIQSLDVSQYKWVSLQVMGTFQATIKFQGSNDNGTFSNIIVQTPGVILEPYVTEKIDVGLVKIPVLFKYLRVRVTSYTSGTVQGVAFAYVESNDSGQISSTGTVSLGASTQEIGSVKFLPAIATDPIYHKIISEVGVNSTSLKSSPGNIGILHIVNGAATTRYFKLYNQTTAPNVGTDVPMITITLAPGASNFTLPALVGINFDVGIAYAIMLSVADDSSTAFTVAGEVTAMIAYT